PTAADAAQTPPTHDEPRRLLRPRERDPARRQRAARALLGGGPAAEGARPEIVVAAPAQEVAASILEAPLPAPSRATLPAPAFLGFPASGGQSQVDLVPEDAQSLREVAEQAGLTLSEAKRAFLIQGDDRVGAVADTTAKLAGANVNLTAAAATSAGSGRFGMI